MKDPGWRRMWEELSQTEDKKKKKVGRTPLGQSNEVKECVEGFTTYRE
jgi:hypothetical protein